MFGCDPDSTVLSDHYDEIMARFRRPDPQVIPDDLFSHYSVTTPEKVLASRVFEVLGDSSLEGESLKSALRDEVAAFGQGFIPEPA